MQKKGFGPPADIWSLGCIVAELFLQQPLFPADTEEDLLQLVTLFLKFLAMFWLALLHGRGRRESIWALNGLCSIVTSIPSVSCISSCHSYFHAPAYLTEGGHHSRIDSLGQWMPRFTFILLKSQAACLQD